MTKTTLPMAPPMADVLRATSINETVVVSGNEESGDTKCGTFVELVIFHNAEKKFLVVIPVTVLLSLVDGATQNFWLKIRRRNEHIGCNTM